MDAPLPIHWKTFFERDPYADFDWTQWPNNPQGWGSKHPIFKAVITAIRPSLIVEVGTWKGASAIHMANQCSEQELNTKIVCVDTWLGTIESYTWRKRKPGLHDDLRFKNGFPQLYFQFLANVCYAGYQTSIIPFPQTSIIGARFLKAVGAIPDVIYIDASHDYEDVKVDLRSYYEILRDGGVIFGDDYNCGWKGVTQAVNEFAREVGVSVLGTRGSDRRKTKTGKFAFAKGPNIAKIFGDAGLLTKDGGAAGLHPLAL